MDGLSRAEVSAWSASCKAGFFVFPGRRTFSAQPPALPQSWLSKFFIFTWEQLLVSTKMVLHDISAGRVELMA